MDKAERLAVVGQVKEYIKEIVNEIRQELMREVLSSEEGAKQAHYTGKALKRLEDKIQADINAGKREMR
jgi:hypothetical protein